LRTDLKETKVGVLAGFDTEMEESMTEGLNLLPISIVLIIIVLYLSLRRGSDVLLSVVGIPIIFVWMFGISSAIGIKMTVLSFFGPILILALGIDYAILSLHRYKEESKKEAAPGDAVRSSITHVGAAIFLGAVTTTAAFFSNFLSSIPAIQGFGITLGIGIISAFIVMGIFIPTLRFMLDDHRYKKVNKRGRRNPERGRRPIGKAGKERGSIKKGVAKGGKIVKGDVLKAGMEHRMARSILRITSRPSLVIVIVLLITVVSLFGAFQLGTEFSPKDFMPEDSEVMAALDLMEEHFPRSSTETAEILVVGEVAEPEVLIAIEETVENMKDDVHVPDIDGTPEVVYICPYVNEVMMNSTLVVELNVTDGNDDLIPDSKDDIMIVFDFLYENGIGNATTIDIRHVLHRDPDGNYDMTLIWIDVVDGEGLGNMKDIKDELEEDSQPLEALEDKGTIRTVVTGEPVVIYVVIMAMMDSMVSSIAICLIVCLVVLLLVFRSVRFSIVTMIPVCLVATWVLGMMFALGYSFNVTTILIVAITIGVGIDYSIHFTHRYREERGQGKGHEDAVEDTLRTTGTALLGAAATTGLGFSVLAFASMPMFAAFGILTAFMVLCSYTAAVIVLPVLLKFVDRNTICGCGREVKRSWKYCPWCGKISKENKNGYSN